MPIWEWIVIAAVAVVFVAAVVVIGMVSFRTKTKRLKQHYGPEYERVVDEKGSEKGAVREPPRANASGTSSTSFRFTLGALRVHRGLARGTGRIRDNPATAVGDADRLVTEVMRERGYPVDDFERRAADISVDHPQVVDNYRAAHGIHVSEQHADTEQQRKAFVHYRALFEKLLETSADSDTSQERSA